jgi:hypothetical protein
MTSAQTKRTTGNILIWTLWFCGAIPSALVRTCAQAGAAEEPIRAALPQMGNGGAIRVESNEVLVPVLVLDKKRVAQLQGMNPYIFDQEVSIGNFSAWQAAAVRDLTARDFRLLVDGREEPIKGVIPQEQGSPPIVRDNVGRYVEFVGIGGGTWTERAAEDDSPNYPVGTVDLPPLPGYLISYLPSEASQETCHHLAVMVNRPDSLVFSRDEYCDARNAPSDPLRGTKLGTQLEADLVSEKKGKIDMSVAAIPLFGSLGGFVVRIVAEFPSKPVLDDCTTQPEAVGVFGTFSTESGIVESFSDVAFSSVANGSSVGDIAAFLVAPQVPNRQCMFESPIRYETQVHLPPGKFGLRVVLTDGKKLGRADVPVTVNSYDRTQLAISGIAIARRFREAPTGSQQPPTALPENLAPLVTKGIEVTPTANTHFKKGDLFYFYFQIYKPQIFGANEPTVEARLRIVDVKTGSIVKQLEPASAESYATPGNPVISIGGGIDLSNLPNGSYELEVQATDSAGNASPWRVVDFTVE